MINRNQTKTIALTVRLWTNDLADDGGLIPGHAWDQGTVALIANTLHGVRAVSAPVQFSGLMAIGSAVAEVLQASGVTLHACPVTRRLLAGDFAGTSLERDRSGD
jgi:hypothetical protein